MTEEQAYELGRRRAAETLAALDERPPAAAEDPVPGPRIGSPEWEAARLADSLLRQDAAREELRRQAPAPAVQEYDTAAEERRGWALQRAAMAEPARRMGQDAPGEAMVLPNGAAVLVERKNGLISKMVPAAFPSRVIRPHEWPEFDQQWHTQQRRAENELLARFYGADQCVEAGLFSEDEKAQLDPERSRRVELPPGVEAL